MSPSLRQSVQVNEKPTQATELLLDPITAIAM